MKKTGIFVPSAKATPARCASNVLATVIEKQIHEVRVDLPPGYYRQLPKLASGPFAGYPRLLSVAWAYVAHTDTLFDPEVLRRYLSRTSLSPH